MYRFFEYCFYRICFVYYKRKIDTSPNVYACGWVCAAQLFNILTIINIYQIFTNAIFDKAILVWGIAIPIYFVNYFIFFTKQKYKWMVEYYKNEKHRKLKGWGVFLYVSVSILVFPCIRIIFC
jgi:hypothetical protein